MKSILIKIIFSIGILVAVQSASAASLFGWQTTVTATDGSNLYSQGISAPSHLSCQIKRQQTISFYTSAPFNYTILSAPPCSPVFLKIPKILDLNWEEIRWPPGPVCLSCPFLQEDIINQIYPRQKERVKELIREYNIKNYQEELKLLNERYNMGDFEKEMFGVELRQHHPRSK